MFYGYYPLNLEFNKALTGLPDVKTSDHKSRGLDITVVSNGVVQNATGMVLWCSAKTSDNRTVTQQAELEDASTGHYMLTFPDSMINKAGEVSIELALIDGSQTISTNTGTINVVEAVTSYENMEDDPNYPALLKAMDAITTMQNQIASMQTQIDSLEKFETGCIVMSPTALDSRFWVPLDGRSTANYSTLSPMFGDNLPDMRGKVAAAIDSTQAEFNALGEIGGEKTHQLTSDELATHNHGLHMYKTIDENVGHYSLVPASMSGSFEDRGIVNTLAGYTSLIDEAGGDKAHNNLQPYCVLGNYYVHI